MDDYGMNKVFQDDKQRPIEIIIEDDWPALVIAKYQGKKIGHLEFVEFQDSGLQLLAHAEMDGNFRKAGIASQMMKEISELDPDLLVPNPLWTSSTHEYYFSSEGAALLNSCLRHNILTKANIAPYE